MKTITKYISTLIYILLYLSLTIKKPNQLYYINNALSILYGPICAVAFCGLIINNFFHEEIRKRDNTSTLVRIGSDIFGHILPLVLIVLYGPKKTSVSFIYYLIIIFIFFYLCTDYLLRVYIGVPRNLITIVAPLICITAFYMRFIYK